MPYSTFSKIYDLLSVMDKAGPKDIFELSHEIHETQIESFAIWRRPDGSGQPIKSYCSEASIRRLTRFAHALGLIDIENQRICQINDIGRYALSEDNYATQLGTQVMRYMRESIGLPFDELERHIESIKRPAIPDGQTIYQTLVLPRKLSISEDQFRRLLYLLQRCGILSGIVRKIYSSTRG
jgi:hypothetical protein